jgi:hypothetical protein
MTSALYELVRSTLCLKLIHVIFYFIMVTHYTPLKCLSSCLFCFSTRPLSVSFLSRLISFGALGRAFSLSCPLLILTSMGTPNCDMLGTITTERYSVLQISCLRPRHEVYSSSFLSALGISTDSMCSKRIVVSECSVF